MAAPLRDGIGAQPRRLPTEVLARHEVRSARQAAGQPAHVVAEIAARRAGRRRAVAVFALIDVDRAVAAPARARGGIELACIAARERAAVVAEVAAVHPAGDCAIAAFARRDDAVAAARDGARATGADAGGGVEGAQRAVGAARARVECDLRDAPATVEADRALWAAVVAARHEVRRDARCQQRQGNGKRAHRLIIEERDRFVRAEQTVGRVG